MRNEIFYIQTKLRIFFAIEVLAIGYNVVFAYGLKNTRDPLWNLSTFTFLKLFSTWHGFCKFHFTWNLNRLWSVTIFFDNLHCSIDLNSFECTKQFGSLVLYHEICLFKSLVLLLTLEIELRKNFGKNKNPKPQPKIIKPTLVTNRYLWSKFLGSFILSYYLHTI